MERDVFHIVSPYQKRTPSRTPSKVVVSGEEKKDNQHSPTRSKQRASSPRVFYYEAQIVLLDKLDGFLDVSWRSCIDTDYRHAPLLTRNPEGSVEVTALDGPIGKGVRFPVGEFGGARLIRSPDAVVPTSEDIGAVSCGRVVARGGWWDGMDQWLRDF